MLLLEFCGRGALDSDTRLWLAPITGVSCTQEKAGHLRTKVDAGRVIGSTVDDLIMPTQSGYLGRHTQA